MATINEGLVALTELRSDVETHAWQLDEYEHWRQRCVRRAGQAPTP
ncbi:hypothetical protein OG840_22990 [Streptomyces sp. NBC_01764]|nr:hypothetical protein [Streptomyces sp. NBC_01764]MCX4404468.1 hypothetical protein [Streptomyces sp. NBC_01764]